MSMSDRRNSTEELALRAKDDPDAFVRLFRRLAGRLKMWIALRLRPGSWARVEEVLQETFLEAHRRLGEFQDRGPGSFREWVFAVAGELGSGRERLEEERALLERLVVPEGSAELQERLCTAIAGLPEELADVLIQREIEGRSYAVIAHRIKAKRSLVQARYVRALRSLNDELA